VDKSFDFQNQTPLNNFSSTTMSNSAPSENAQAVPSDRSIMGHKNAAAARLYAECFDDAAKQIDVLVASIAAKTGKQPKKIKDDLFAYTTLKHNTREVSGWNEYVTQRMEEENRGETLQGFAGIC
jgi:hypothetical protein